MSAKKLPDPIADLFDEAVEADRFRSRSAILKEAKLSSGFFSERQARLREQGYATLNEKTAEAISRVLGVEMYRLFEVSSASANDDPYPSRAWAIVAARALQMPEVAIQAVMSENPGSDPGRLYWFHRIETEAERFRPAAASHH